MNVTTRELFNRAAAAADMHDNFVTPAQFAYWASQENLALALFIARSGWSQNVLTETITVAGDEDGVFPLTADPLAIVAVHHVVSDSYRLLKHTDYVTFLRQTPGATLARGTPKDFCIKWNQEDDEYVLGFYPEPSAGDTIVVSYIPEPDRLTLSENPAAGYANSVNYPMGWEERIVLGVARRVLAKEESDTSEMVRQIRECESSIEEACWNRALAESPTIRNIEAPGRRDGYPAPTSWVFL